MTNGGQLHIIAYLKNILKIISFTGEKSVKLQISGVCFTFLICFTFLSLATICNIRDESPTFTEDGFELTFGVNHLGHFLLTLLLIDDLKKSGPDSRVIIVSSELHNSSSKGHRGSKFPTMDFENIQLLAPGTFDAMLAYKNSKLANVLFSYEFDRNVHGSGLTCNCVAPGFVPQTRLNRRNQIIRCMVIACFRGILRCLPISRSASKAADSIVYVATDDNLQGVGGKYFIDCSVVDSSQESMNREVAEKLWKLSADFVQYDAQKAAESSN